MIISGPVPKFIPLMTSVTESKHFLILVIGLGRWTSKYPKSYNALTMVGSVRAGVPTKMNS
jgi:hypothetical protein